MEYAPLIGSGSCAFVGLRGRFRGDLGAGGISASCGVVVDGGSVGGRDASGCGCVDGAGDGGGGVTILHGWSSCCVVLREVKLL